MLSLERSLPAVILAAALSASGPPHAPEPWPDALRARIERIDRESPGQLGVYVKRLEDGKTMSYQANRPWYLGSTVKLPVALAVLQEVQAGRRSLDEKVTLRETDKIDGSGKVVWQENGTAYRIGDLLEEMLMQSDNTAGNMLIRTIGEDTLNARARDYLGRRGYGRLTTFSQVRYDVYGELHPGARELSNTDLVKLAAADMGPARVTAFRKMASLDEDELKVRTIDEAYARYYARGFNVATLEAYGGMLEKLVRGQLLSAANMKTLFAHMKYGSYHAYRLEAGLPKTGRFIHKTGTQFERACHMGVVDPQDGGRAAIVIAACAEDLDEAKEAGQVFEKVGRAVSEVLLN